MNKLNNSFLYFFHEVLLHEYTKILQLSIKELDAKIVELRKSSCIVYIESEKTLDLTIILIVFLIKQKVLSLKNTLIVMPPDNNDPKIYKQKYITLRGSLSLTKPGLYLFKNNHHIIMHQTNSLDKLKSFIIKNMFKDV